MLGGLQPGATATPTQYLALCSTRFMGAGTVALAAEKHGRNWVGIELNPAFAALARERLVRWRREQHK